MCEPSELTPTTLSLSCLAQTAAVSAVSLCATWVVVADVPYSACLCVGHTAKWLNRSTCRMGCLNSGGPKEPRIIWGPYLSREEACWRSVDILDVIHLITKLDAGQSPTLARPVAPLASFGQRISSVDKANKNWLSWQGPLSDRKTNFRLVICIRSSNNPENDRSSRFWDNWHESLKINKKHSAARQAKQADSSEWIFSVDGARCRPVIMCAWMGRLNMQDVNVQHVSMYDSRTCNVLAV